MLKQHQTSMKYKTKNMCIFLFNKLSLMVIVDIYVYVYQFIVCFVFLYVKLFSVLCMNVHCIAAKCYMSNYEYVM